MVQAAKYSGYRHLVPINQAGNMFSKTEYIPSSFLLGDPNTNDRACAIHGPAMVIREDFGERSEDIVNALRLNHVPEELDLWFMRVRKAEWPGKSFQEYVKQCDYFLVPVGHKQSKTHTHEFRICCSFAERQLMFEMNMTQLRCLIIMKMIVKTHVDKVYYGAIKSFFCKTALFYTVEQTQNKGWNPENIVACVTRCFQWLIHCLNCDKMPHYFMPNLNMLEGRFSRSQRRSLVKVLSTVTSDCENAILKIHIDEVGDRLCSKLDSVNTPNCVCAIFPDVEIKIGQFLLDAYYKYCRFGVPTLLKACGGNYGDLETTIAKIEFYLRDTDRVKPEYVHSVSNRLNPHFLSSLGTLKAAVLKQDDSPLSVEVTSLLASGITSDVVCGILKYASVLCSFGEYNAADVLITEALVRHSSDVAAICGCSKVRMFEFPEVFCMKWKEMLSNNTVEDSTAFCVIFVTNEVSAIPEVFRELICPADGPPRDIVSIDPLPYLYALQYLICRYTSDSDRARTALKSLKDCVETAQLYHPDTTAFIRDKCIHMEEQRQQKDNY